MFAEIAKSRLVLCAAALPPLAVLIFFAMAGSNRRFADNSPSSDVSTVVPVENMRIALAKDRQILTEYEKEQSLLRAEVIKRRQLFQAGQISHEQVVAAEQSYVNALKHVHEMRSAVTETDIAITEAILGEKVLRLPILPVGGYTQTAELTRFNGGFKWSIREASRVEKFYAQTFGHNLPISALGQSATHNRLGYDHRDSLDVALHPDSAEGKKLIDYLHKSGIPFLAFRQAVPGTATGPHIHIGRPSSRLAS